jgi:hypothetical protein
MMQLFVLSAFALLAYGQQRTCIYQDPKGYQLNLTAISDWTLELETPDFFFYYTPCGNRMECRQGNADYHANVAQYKQGVNGCAYYLAVDHHQPATYSWNSASWHFQFNDGEECEQRQAPRTTDIWYNCDAEQHHEAWFVSVNEPRLCEYEIQIHSPLACVPENQFNANCQYKAYNSQKQVNMVDLSALKGQVIRATGVNGYDFYLSPCANGLHCYQQYGAPVMSMIENEVTHTCDHYTAVWEDGRVQPLFHDSDPDQVHWSFHYWNGQRCSNGQANEETIRYYCDVTADPFKVINATGVGNCHFEMNIASKYACPTSDILIEAKPVF